MLRIASVAANVVSYSDSNLTAGSTYCYRVRAFNAAGASAADQRGLHNGPGSHDAASATISRTPTSITGTPPPTSANTNPDCADRQPVERLSGQHENAFRRQRRFRRNVSISRRLTTIIAFPGLLKVKLVGSRSESMAYFTSSPRMPWRTPQGKTLRSADHCPRFILERRHRRQDDISTSPIQL